MTNDELKDIVADFTKAALDSIGDKKYSDDRQVRRFIDYLFDAIDIAQEELDKRDEYVERFIN